MILLPILLATDGFQSVDLTKHSVITQSAKVKPGIVALPNSDDDAKTAAITIKGDDLVVDFGGAVLQGTPQTVEPDLRKGTGVIVQGKNVTIKNLKVRGYKIGLIARSCPGLKIIDSDLSYNWKQHLLSTLEREDESDWMSYHHNENDEWLRYGAGIYLSKCDGFEVRNCTITGGQCGLMLVGSNKGLVWNNDFSFLSGVGVGLYRSSDNRIMHNKIDWCVRGFSYGVYNRGQDSAGILIFEQCNRNIFAYNSATHGGDGFFLWAGQTTMDSGQGGCNDNILYGNDFSHSPANGIEATFSRNVFANNLMLECWHGIWGGYSYDTPIVGNVFSRNAESIAIEHGQNISVIGNSFVRENLGVNIWSNDGAPDPNWGYPKHRDTKSHDTRVEGNLFEDIVTDAIRIHGTSVFNIVDNTFVNNGSLVGLGPKCENVFAGGNRVLGVGKGSTFPDAVRVPAPTVSGLAQNSFVAGQLPKPSQSALNQGEIGAEGGYASRFRHDWNPFLPLSAVPDSRSGPKSAATIGILRGYFAKYSLAPLKGGQNPFLKPGALRGWRYMLIDEWGPYDFRRPVLWPRSDSAEVKSGAMKRVSYEILGPPGKWKLVSFNGQSAAALESKSSKEISMTSGDVPGAIAMVEPTNGGNIDLVLEYVGGATNDYRGIVTPAGKPVRFSYRRFFAPIDWTVKFFKWKEAENPSDVHSAPKESALQEIFKGQPIKELKTNKLDFNGASFDPSVGNDHYATVANGKFELPAGDYVIELTTDDGARMWLDNKPIISDAWKYQGPTPYAAKVHLDKGAHTLRLEHFQIDGYASLQVRIKPAGK